MLKTTFTSLLLLAVVPLFSQKYITAAGLHLGGGIGITVQQLLWQHYTAEMQLQKGFINRLTTFTTLFEMHQPILSKGANFYIGAGPHAGSYNAVHKEGGKQNVFGISSIGGIEFKFGNTLLSADLKPVINLAGGSSVFDTQAGISLRYVLIKAPRKEHKWMFWKKRKHSRKEDKNTNR